MLCRLGAIRRAKGRHFRGAKGDYHFRGGPDEIPVVSTTCGRFRGLCELSSW